MTLRRCLSPWTPRLIRAMLHQVRDRRRQALEIAWEDRLILTELAFALARPLAHDVAAAAELVTMRHLSISAHLHAFCCTAVGTNLRHFFSPWSSLPGW